MTAADPLEDASPSAQSVLEAARTYERDRYLSALLAPAEARDDLLTIAAYIGELKRIPLLTREAAIGEIRLQWWRDALQDPDSVTGHPVADALKDVARRWSLRQDLVTAPIEGFSRELYEDGIRNADELRLYAEETDGAAFMLGLAVLGALPEQDAEPLIAAAAKAQGLTRLAVSLPQHLAHGRLPLPPFLLEEAGDPRGMDAANASTSVQALTARLGAEASSALDELRQGQGRLRSGQISALLPVCLVALYLKVALKPGRDVLLHVADISPLSRVTRLWFAHLRGRI